jgi:predicted DNA-binding transcriptional regulator AlpA
MENQIVLINVNELKSIINESVSNAFSKIPQAKEDDVLLKRKDVASLFSVSLVTIADWMKTNKIPYYRINSRIFFKRKEVLEALQSKKKFKTNSK